MCFTINSVILVETRGLLLVSSQLSLWSSVWHMRRIMHTSIAAVTIFLSALCWAWLANKPPKKQEGRKEAGVKGDWIRKASYPFLHGLNCVNWQKTWQIHRRVFSFTARVLISPQGLNSIVFTSFYNPTISILVTETIKSNPTLASVGLNKISGPSDWPHLWLQSHQPPQRPPSWKLPLLPPSNPLHARIGTA